MRILVGSMRYSVGLIWDFEAGEGRGSYNGQYEQG